MAKLGLGPSSYHSEIIPICRPILASPGVGGHGNEYGSPGVGGHGNEYGSPGVGGHGNGSPGVGGALV